MLKRVGGRTVHLLGNRYLGEIVILKIRENEPNCDKKVDTF